MCSSGIKRQAFNLAAFPLHGCEWAHLMQRYEGNQEEKAE